MKSGLIIFLAFCLINQSSYSQDSTKNSLKESKFALQFQIGTNFTLKDFQGSTLSFKYQIFDESAVRVGFSISSSVETYREENHIEEPKQNYFDITLNAQFIKYLKTFEDISLYTGGGPRFFSEYYTSLPSGYHKYWSLGLDGILGVEWFFKKNMSLSAEYGISIVYWVTDINDPSSTSKFYNTKRINIGDNNMLKFGISIYL